jgi:hypothetical protein
VEIKDMDMYLKINHVFFNVLVLQIADVVEEIILVLIHIYLVDKVEWAYVFEDKVESVEVGVFHEKKINN